MPGTGPLGTSLTFGKSHDPDFSLLRPSVEQVLLGDRHFPDRHNGLEDRKFWGKAEQSRNIVSLHKDDGQVGVINARIGELRTIGAASEWSCIHIFCANAWFG